MSVKSLLNSIALPLASIIGVNLMLASGTVAGSQQAQDDPHAHHKHMMKQTGYTSSSHRYEIPELSLIDTHNNKLSFTEIINTEKPVILNFIFTTCTTICPVLSATLSQVKQKLGDDAQNVKMISITIDPEQDTPERLKDYASKFKAGADWHFLTGSIDDIITTQKAFDAYKGDKMNHIPLTFLRSKTPNSPWIRLEGFTSAAEVLAEHRLQLSN
ncbi:MAG: SCO family protein [endosymbiont of Galathealinum brachiosum]|uniref:SCO family protein n=1 Tax=endosymbiont of Galathealinum brachiosum TaxID=2200906 RepID=A0A370DN51_9GAMM|nr:MAG: SCO family protein [endosymbiont of Galathealinum brachiosum]